VVARVGMLLCLLMRYCVVPLISHAKGVMCGTCVLSTQRSRIVVPEDGTLEDEASLYKAQMTAQGTYGDSITLTAIAAVLKRKVRVFDCNGQDHDLIVSPPPGVELIGNDLLDVGYLTDFHYVAVAQVLTCV
jgi:hypothetical protein